MPATEQCTDIATMEPAGGAIQQAGSSANPIMAMMERIMSSGAGPQETAAAMEKLTALYLQVEDRNASRAFGSAKAQLQAAIRHVRAVKPVPGNDGRARYYYAPYEHVMAEVAKPLADHGFSVAFTQRYDGPRVVIVCKLTHEGGHSESNEFAVRIGQGPPKSSEAQGDGAASTYAKRRALCDALNIVCEVDSDGSDDARNIGTPIPAEKAREIAHRIDALWPPGTPTNRKAVDRCLQLAEADTFAAIPTGKLAVIEDLLKKAEQDRAAKASAPPPATPTPPSPPPAPSDPDEAQVIAQLVASSGIDPADAEGIVSKHMRLKLPKRWPDLAPDFRRDWYARMVLGGGFWKENGPK